MGKTKIVLLGTQKIYKDKKKSSTVSVTVLGMYKSCNDRLINILSDVVTLHISRHTRSNREDE